MTRASDPPVDGDPGDASLDAELGRILEAYLADLEAGRPVDPDRLLAEHPSLASQLRSCLAVVNLADRVADGTGPAAGDRSAARSDATAIPMAPGVLSTWDRLNGPPPRVHLHDLADDDEPMVRPGSPAMPVIPEGSWGRYQLQGEIARGGMGAVIKGRDADLGRDLAIKVLLESHRRNPEIVRRFIEEAQIGGQLQHPGIVPVYELGTCADRRPYFAMKLVRGRTLASMLQARAVRSIPPAVGAGSDRRPDPDGRGTEPPPTGIHPQIEGLPTHDDLPRFLSIFEQICQTIAYVHARGVIHRDLKPSNVMVGSFGEVQVMDWGLAKVLARGGIADEAANGAKPLGETVVMTVRSGPAGSGSESQAGSVLGTPAYMSPEQARGDVERLDERADVFGLGAILCEVLTGRPPYVGATREEVRARAARGDLADAISRLDDCGADADLIRLARDCAAAEPERRPRDAGEVSRRLTAYLAGVQDRLTAAEMARVEAQARAQESQARARIERSRRRFVVVLSTTVLVMAGLAGASWVRIAQDRATRDAVATQAIADANRLHDLAVRGPLVDIARLGEAIAVAERARAVLGTGGDPAQRDMARALLTKLEEERREAESDRAMLARLAEIRSTRGYNFAEKIEADTGFARAFAGYGIPVDALPSGEAAARIRARPGVIAVELAAALDDWALVRRERSRPPDEWRQLLITARLSDADTHRDRLRAALIAPDRQARRVALGRLAMDETLIEALAAPSLDLLGRVLIENGEAGLAEKILRRARQRFPGDVWINYQLAEALQGMRPPKTDEAIRYFTVVQSLRPTLAHALGHALQNLGRDDEAIAVFRDLVGRQPKPGHHHICLAHALTEKGATPEANGLLDQVINEFRPIVKTYPDNDEVHMGLGDALAMRGMLEEAIGEFREAVRLAPNSIWSHKALAGVLSEQQRLDEAITELREALRIDPNDPDAHNNLGAVLLRHGKLDEAITELREAVRLKPDHALAHCNAGHVLGQQGRFAEALAELKRGHELGSKTPNWRAPSAQWMRDMERLIELDAKLPSILTGKAKAADAVETLGFAMLCYRKKLHGASARFWAEASRAQPKLIDDMRAQHRYNAACAAALAGCGQGKDIPPLDGAAMARWRKQAIDWLKADLTAWSKILESAPPQSRQAISQTLQHWKADTDLAGLREPAAVAKLAEHEQKACRALWSEVDTLLKKARAANTP